MRVIVMVKATGDSEAGVMPEPGMFEAMHRFNEELVAAGLMKSGDGLRPSSHGARVRFDGASRSVTMGPFGPPEELVAGFWLWEVRDLDEAIDWVKRCPNPMPGPSDIEIRPLYEMEDFGDALPPEVAEQEEEMRRRLGG
ncbi:YciI family protein [Rhodobacter sp. NSM]|uniref:YciI family protein n=1 Tax=Rhodobacter sp. NSM TaxID=3457501 RepID=UPI003FD14C29